MTQTHSPFRDHWIVHLLYQLNEIYVAKENINQHSLLQFALHRHTCMLTSLTCPAWEEKCNGHLMLGTMTGCLILMLSCSKKRLRVEVSCLSPEGKV